MTLKRLSLLLNSFYLLLLLLFLFEEFTAFDIKNQFIKSFVYPGTFILSFVLPFWNLFVWKWMPGKIIGTVVPVAISILMMKNIGHFIFAKGVWEAQVILYQNKNNTFQTVEYQLQDIGALGYNRRTVKVTSIIGLFMIATEVEDDFQPGDDWVKVDKYVGPEEPEF